MAVLLADVVETNHGGPCVLEEAGCLPQPSLDFRSFPLAAAEAKINAELLAAQGKPVDTGGARQFAAPIVGSEPLTIELPRIG